MKLGSWWRIVCFAMGNAVVLALLLSGCASSGSQGTAAAATDSWGRCDRARMVNFMLFCRQTTAEPVSDRLDDGIVRPPDTQTSAPNRLLRPN